MSGAAGQIAGVPAYVCAPDGPRLDGPVAAADILGEAFGGGARLVVIPVGRLGAGFLDLSTGIAGEVIQKFVNYGFMVAILGDVSGEAARSSALRDFVRESNRGRHLCFAADEAELDAWLLRRA